MLAPETAVSPVAQAPPDRQTLGLEQWARQGIALIFGDNKLDQDEMKILRSFMKEIALRAQAAGGIGMGGGTPQAEGAASQPSYYEQNMNTEDMGTAQGAEPMDEEGY